MSHCLVECKAQPLISYRNKQEHSTDEEKGASNESFLTDRNTITVDDDTDNEISSWAFKFTLTVKTSLFPSDATVLIVERV